MTNDEESSLTVTGDGKVPGEWHVLWTWSWQLLSAPWYNKSKELSVEP